MARSKEEIAAEKKELKPFEVKTGNGLVDGMLASIDIDKDGLSDAAEINRFYQKHKPMIDLYSPLIVALGPDISEQGLAEAVLNSGIIKPDRKENARKTIGQFLTVTKQLAAEAKAAAEVAKDVAEAVQAVKSVTGK